MKLGPWDPVIRHDDVEFSYEQFKNGIVDLIDNGRVLADRSVAISNLASVFAVVEKHGVSDALLDLINDNNQLGEFFNIDLSCEDSKQILSDTIYNYFQTVEIDEETASTESIVEIILATVIIGFYAAIVITAIILEFKSQRPEWERAIRFYKGKCLELLNSVQPNQLNEYKFGDISFEGLTASAMITRLDMCVKLMNYIVELANSKDADVDRDKIISIFMEGGVAYLAHTTCRAEVVNDRKWTYRAGPIDEMGFTKKTPVQLIDKLTECLNVVENGFDTLDKLKHTVKSAIAQAKSEKSSGAITKQEYILQKEKVHQDHAALYNAVILMMNYIVYTADMLVGVVSQIARYARK